VDTTEEKEQGQRRRDGGKGRERRERRERAKHADRSQSPAAGSCPSVTGAIAICETPDVLLKNIQIKYLQNTSVYKVKHLQQKHVKIHEKSLQNICNTQIKHLQNMSEMFFY
jgi:hypothetical protein